MLEINLSYAETKKSYLYEWKPYKLILMTCSFKVYIHFNQNLECRDHRLVRHDGPLKKLLM